MIWRMAWRNVWRNPRRTGILLLAAAVGIMGVLLSMAINYGMIYQMIDTAIATDLGHLQVHAVGFDEDPSLAVRLPDSASRATAIIETTPGIRYWAPHVRGEGLVSSAHSSAGVRIVGVDPTREADVSLIRRSITRGRYLDTGERRIVIGEALARRLSAEPGDKLVIAVQDLSGDMNAEAVRVGGVFRSPSTRLDRSTAFLRIADAQRLFGLRSDISELVLVANSRERIGPVQRALQAALPETEVRRWDELQPVLVYLVNVTEQFAVWLYLAIFVAMAFGIANVLLMAVYERIREIGVLMAIGFSRGKLVSLIAAESLVVTSIGLLVGSGGALVATAALHGGIDLSLFAEGLGEYGVGTRIVPVLRRSDFLVPVLVALATAIGASLWPAWRAARLRPAEAVRHE